MSVSLCSLQVQKKNYREEKKRATKELLSTITDPSVIVMADWLKVGTSSTTQSIFPAADVLIVKYTIIIRIKVQ